MSLNPEQEQVVQHYTGPLRVGAVAGSGKTRALVERVAYLMEKKHVHPNQILTVTFGKDAAKEMKRRIRKRLPGAGADKCARTFHSVGLEVFKQERPDEGRHRLDTTGGMYTIATRMAAKQLGLKPQKIASQKLASLVKNHLIDTSDVLRRLGRIDGRMVAFARMVASDQHADHEDLINIYYLAEKIREEQGVYVDGRKQTFVTFDDMIYQAARLLCRRDIRERWGQRWKYVLQDEAQDENPAQAAIVEALASQHRNYMIVGDPAQSIYSFRGARPETMVAFEDNWPGAKTMILNRNYRSGIEVVELANDILGCMPASTVVTDDLGDAPSIVSERNTRAYVGYHVFQDADDEAEHIAQNCIDHHSDGVLWGDQAVLLRLNHLTRRPEIAFAEKRIPYRLLSGQSFFDQWETRFLLSYLQVAANRADKNTLGMCLRHPPRYLTKKLEKAIVDAGPPEDGDWTKVVRYVVSRDAERKTIQRIEEWSSLIDAIRRSTDDAAATLRMMMHRTGSWKWLMGDSAEDEDHASADTVEEVLDYASSFDTIHELLDHVDDINAYRKASNRKKDAVTISTVHKAKGQEWPIVYLIHLAQGFMPHHRSETPDEERRVFYVAATRAMDELWMSRPLAYEDAQLDHSMFLEETGRTEPSAPASGKQVDPQPVGAQLTLQV